MLHCGKCYKLDMSDINELLKVWMDETCRQEEKPEEEQKRQEEKREEEWK